jgi:four helix bundle protein
MQRFTELKVWERSHALALRIYRMTAGFPAEERFGVTSQMRRAIVSVPTNIAEGSKRLRRADYARFLNIAEASLAEVEYLLILSRDLSYVHAAAVEELTVEINEVASMLSKLRARVEKEHRD